MVKLFRLLIISSLVMLLATACATSDYEYEEWNPWVNSVAFSPDSRYALAGGHDMDLQLLDVASLSVIRTLPDHPSWVYSVAFSPDGQYALSGSSDGTMRLWEVASGKEIKTLSHGAAVNSVAVSPDGKYALSGGDSESLKLWGMNW